MKQFNLDEYNRLKAEGKEPKIVTRDGYPVSIVRTDLRNIPFPVLAIVHKEVCDMVMTYTTKGGVDYSYVDKNEQDIFFADSEPTYRPYKDAEECFKDTIKHGGWIISGGDQYRFITVIKYRSNHNIVKFTDSIMTFEDLMKAVWADDGSVCGKLIDE